MSKKIVITGGAGFIGSHVVRLFVNKYPSYQIFNLDCLTYAGNLENLKDIQDAPNYTFLKADINNAQEINDLFEQHAFDAVIHLAAESHVDRSITDPNAFIQTNVMGTANLLNAAKTLWKNDYTNKRFYHVSTDEVYGSLGETGFFLETTPYDPQSPYSASKAASDHLVRAYYHTYNLPITISNCSNNFGPFQFPEKVIPVAITNLLEGRKVPVYGDGLYVRDWLYVEDHCNAIFTVLKDGIPGQTYNIGGHNEKSNIELVNMICLLLDDLCPKKNGTSYRDQITYVTDRPGHDRRYAINAEKIENELNWKPSETFKTGIYKTVKWYLDHQEWTREITNRIHQYKMLNNKKHQ